jgi:NHLM bacteriocin system ABC transporter ATP-binding protein
VIPGDPGLSLKATTLSAALRLLGLAEGASSGEQASIAAEGDAEDAVEAWAVPAGHRSRRVKLDGRWWEQAGGAMLARVADRRRVARGEEKPTEITEAAGTGWVALVPERLGGYRMLASYPEVGTTVEWRVDEKVAARLAPFAFTFHPRFARRALEVRDLLHFAWRQGRGEIVLILLAALAAALVALLSPVAMGVLIDRTIPAKDADRLLSIIGALAVAGVALIGLDLVRSLAVMRFEARLGIATQAALVDRVVSAPAAFFRRFASGDLALRMGAVGTVQRALTGTGITAFVTLAFFASSLGLMLAYSPPLTAAAFAIVVLVVAVSTVIGLMRLRVGPRIEALDGRLGAMTFELFAGIAKLRAAAAEPRAFRRWRTLYNDFRDANGDAARLENRELVAVSLLMPAATMLVLWLAWKLPGPSSFTTGDFVAFHAALFGLLGATHTLVSTALDALNLKPTWDRARPILETPPEDAGRGGLVHTPAGAIELARVSFAYPGGPEVLSAIDLSVLPGEFVAIVGTSGSGKSTLLRLLLGFETPSSGAVRYDGRDLATLDLRHLRSRIGTVLQGGKLWAGDLLTNIAGASRASVDEVWAAARAAGLAADIEAMPMGLYTVVGEGLSTLSGGQRQRVLIARALVAKPRILLLDEATSALDNVAQAHVLRGLSALEATRIVIAHRLNTVRDADRIVVIERGRIVEQGRFAELAAAAGPFSRLLARQVA